MSSRAAITALVGALAVAACDRPDAPVGQTAPAAAVALKTRVFLVFDEEKNAVVRRAYSVWDAVPARNLDFEWLPDHATSGDAQVASGSGRLVWRQRGAPSYDALSIVSDYVGTLKDGRAEGRGVLRTRDGVHYDGAWRNGLFDGEGVLVLADGATYTGVFKSGRFHGGGTLVEANNEAYVGEFRNGLKHGRGRTELPSGARYHSVWHDGVEDHDTRHVLLAQASASPETQLPLKPDDVRVTFQVDRPPTERVLAYIARNELTQLSILPDDKRLLDVWKHGAPISNKLRAWDFRSIPLNVRVRNQTDKPLTIKNAFVEVDESASDLQPVFELTYALGMSADGFQCETERHFVPRFSVTNHGWSDPASARLEFTFARAAGEAKTPLATSDVALAGGGGDYDFGPNLKALGVNIAKLTAWSKALDPDEKGMRTRDDIDDMLQCKGLDDKACLAKIKASGTLGKLAPFVDMKDGLIVTHMSGRLIYTWLDAKGVAHEDASPFALNALLGSRSYACGLEAGDEMPDQDPPGVTMIDFQLDGSAYTVKVPFARTLAAGKDARFKLLLRARKSATHKMRLVFETDDGRRLTSKDLGLQTFVSSRYDQKASWK